MTSGHGAKPNLNEFGTWKSLEAALTRVDQEGIGEMGLTLLKRLYPICRSITGNGVRETLGILGEVAKLRVREFPTGYSAFDWTVPKEWNIRDAYVKNDAGERVIDFGRSNLHVVNYSVSVAATMTLQELRPHLHTLPAQPDAIPYRTSYYEERWGFCLAQRHLDSLPEGNYEVLIDSTLEDGHLTLADAVLPGASDRELFLTTYVCHPSLANHELSGPVLSALLYFLLAETEHRLTYRFVFAPETIGALVYLSEYGQHLKERMHAGYVVASVGAPGTFTYKRSRRGGTAADKVAEHCLRHFPAGGPANVVDFSPLGSDERQYCSPGFDLPVGVLTHLMYMTFPEYHTSLDNLDFVSTQALSDSLKLYLRVAQVHDLNRYYLSLSPHGEPQLGRRGLYPQLGGAGGGSDVDSAVERRLYLLAFADGSNDLIDIANRADQPAWDFALDIQMLVEAGLLGTAD